jgi:hypothetical protein
MRNVRTPGIAAGLLILALPASAAAVDHPFTSTASGATGTGTGSPHVDRVRHRVRFGQTLVVRGSVPESDATRRLALEFEPAGSDGWRQVARTTARPSGRFDLHTRLQRSGQVRVVELADGATGAGTATAAADSGAVAPSQPQPIQVQASFRVRARKIDLPTGRTVTIRGHLLPGTSGRRVRLMARIGRHWRVLVRSRTGARGGFTLRYRVPSTGTRWLRVSFAGDRSNRSTWSRAAEVTGMVPSVASWYEDGGQTACGFHATYGVANKSLPCGTRVTLAYGGHSVVATVDDRGPYVAGRTYDLNQNVAAVLGMHAVATVMASR